MKRTGIFYGSNTGATEGVARMIASKLHVAEADVHNVRNTAPSAVAPYDLLIMGTSTWGNGEEQDDWLDFLDGLEVEDLRGKKIALFGLGDETMSETFCSGMGELYERLKGTGAYFTGSYPADVYRFKHSKAVVDGAPVGLMLDRINHDDLTEGRIDGWLLTFRASYG